MRDRMGLVIAVFTVLLGLSWVAAARAAPPPLPSGFNGTVQVDGANVPGGTIISAWIDGVRYAESTTTFYAGDSVYGIGVPGDHPDTPEKDGGVEGDTIVFRIGALVADQRGTFNSGSNEHLDLTASTSVESGSIILVKETDPAGGTGFDFSGDLGGFALNDGDSETFGSLLPGSYDVTEDGPAGWDLDGVMCTGGDSTRITDGVTVELDEGEDVTCVFTNVERGSIVIVKETDPPGGAGFEFIGDLGSFSLDDGESEGFGNRRPRDYDVIEDLPSDWDLAGVVCSGGGSTHITDGVTVHLEPGEDVICTFTNVERQPGSITIVKETEPGGGTGFDFDGDLGSFALDDGGSRAFGDLVSGDYDVTEALPAGWELEDVVCTGGESTGITGGVRIHLDSGEDVVCTFTNVERGSITVVKETDPDGGIGFDFGGDLGDFSLDDDGSETFDALLPGDYDVSEGVPVGWDLDGVVCVGGDSTVAADGVTVHLDPGEDVVCTFTNVERGSITVLKETDPDGGIGFDFGGDLGDFTLADDGSQVFEDLGVGDYGVAEVVPVGWVLDGVVCTGGDSTVAANGVQVHLDPGEDVVCTFTNVERGSITIVKETNPKAGAEFGFTGDLGGFALEDGESESFGSLPPGDYDVAEQMMGQWKLDAVVCVGGDSTAIGNGMQVHLGAGESVTCTFTNIQYRCYVPLITYSSP